MAHTKIPTVYNADDLAKWQTGAGIEGRYYLARPMSWQASGPYAWWLRAKVAWLVFTGQCDALRWGGGQ